MCNLYSITTNQAAIAGLFRVINRYVGNFAPYPAPVIRNSGGKLEMTMMRWGMPPRAGGYPVMNIRNTSSPLPCPGQQLRRDAPEPNPETGKKDVRAQRRPTSVRLRGYLDDLQR